MSYVMPSKNASCNFCPYRILRPNTSCLVLAIDSTILSGGLFYRISNIIQSCIGALQSFLIASNSYQPGVFKTSRLLLSRILIYIHQQFVQEGITTGNTTTDAGHDGGYSQCLFLINLAELGNVLHPDTYQAGVDPQEHRFIIHVRKQGRHLL